MKTDNKCFTGDSIGQLNDNSDILVISLTHLLLGKLKSSGKNISILYELGRTRQQIKKLARQAGSSDLSGESPTGITKELDQYRSRRVQLIDEFDLGFRTQDISDKGRTYSETPGELCDRLISVSLKLDKANIIQNETDIPDETRYSRLDEADRLHALRGHLQQCLKAMLADIEEGKAILPPRYDFKTSQNPFFCPDTAKIKPKPIKKEIHHILGLACTGHGAGLTYINKDGIVRSSVLDRWAGTKYTFLMAEAEIDQIKGEKSDLAKEMHDILEKAYGRFPPYRLFEADFENWLNWLLKGLDVTAKDIDLFVSSDNLFVTSAYCLGWEMNRWFPNASIYLDVEHHRIHQCQAFWPSGFDEAAVVTIDTCGDDLIRLNGRKIAGTLAIMDQSGRCEAIREYIYPWSSAGLIYSIANYHIGYAQGQEGKTMGLAPYGTPDIYNKLKKYLRMYPDGSFDFLSSTDFLEILKEYEYARPKQRDAEFTQKHKNIAFAAQKLVEDILSNTFTAALRLTGQKNLVYAGGVALNSVANEVACKMAQPENIYITPNPGDNGQSLGLALYGAYELAGWPPPNKELSEYIGPVYTDDEIDNAVRSTSFYKTRVDNPDLTMAKCIANGHITARFSGPAEFGPRALGNRSINADPRRHDMKDYLNSRVKRREGFRPFAPSVLIEHVSDWFDMKGRSPHMLRVVDVPEHLQDKIPAIVHVDGTARVQTVDKCENPGYWNLINLFYEITGVPVVLNTSFNVGGKPIVETPQNAVDCFESTNIDVLLLGDWIISKGPLKNYETISR